MKETGAAVLTPVAPVVAQIWTKATSVRLKTAPRGCESAMARIRSLFSLTRAVVGRKRTDAGRRKAVAEPGLSTTANAPLGTVLYVVGDSVDAIRNPEVRRFPLVNRLQGEAKTAHVARVAQLVGEAIGAGGTHLLVPRELADWLGDHPWLAAYMAEEHELAEADPEMGIVIRLHPGMPAPSRR